ncbi:DMT family transporter [Kiloniella sp.]|uniref:DMT family transporter n=1 Tax=Kiloniella sp. TaxID=1938587 RepID=UPI003A934BA4
MSRYKNIPAPLQGALLVVLATFGFSVMNLLVRIAAKELPLFEVTFFRNFFAFLFMLPWMYKIGFKELKTNHLKLHFLRSAVGISAMIVWFASVSWLPMAQAVALNFTVPLFATIGAALILKEDVKLRRWGATIMGFVGVLIIVRPGYGDFSPLLVLPVLAALLMAGSVMIVKTLTKTDSSSVTVFYTTIFMTLLSLLPAIFVWEWPSTNVWYAVVGLGVIGALSNLLITKALSIADASAVMPFDYARLPFMALMAFLAFGEIPDIWTWIGGGVIAISAIYIAQREASIRKKADAALSSRNTVKPASNSPQGTL